MVVQNSSVFPAGRDFVYKKLQQLKTLQYITWPYATFEPIGKTVSTWEVGSTSTYRFRLFGVFVIFPAVSALAAWICTLC